MTPAQQAIDAERRLKAECLRCGETRDLIQPWALCFACWFVFTESPEFRRLTDERSIGWEDARRLFLEREVIV